MSFLYNLFGKGSSKSQSGKYDKISFHINLSDNIPQFFEATQQKYSQERQVTPDHPLYYQIFPQHAVKYVQYLTTQNDTLSGISIKLNISEKKIQDLNGIGHIYPGMRIKLPEGTDISLLSENYTQQNSRMRISQILISNNQAQNFKYQIYYCAGLAGYIKGTFTINPNYIIFNPLIEDTDNLGQFNVEKLLKFNVIIETVDIQEASHLQIPQIPQIQSNQQPKMSSMVQLLLYKVGNVRIEKKYKERLKQLKVQHKAIASISFKVNVEGSNEVSQEIVDHINHNIKNLQNAQQNYEDRKRLTNIPFFDIIHENINPKIDKESQFKQPQNKIIHESAIIGQLCDKSLIITQNNFSHLITRVPILYQLYNWTNIYSSTRDGTSFNTFLNKTKQFEPIILLIKEYKGYVFGAYIVESLQLGKTGRGEMFIFSYKNEQKPQIYQWTTRNQYFVNIDKDAGISIGMGVSYGIFIKNNFEKGSSSSSFTFGNKQPLSLKEDFIIEQIQVWTIQTS